MSDDRATTLKFPLSTLRISVADMMDLKVRTESKGPAPKFLFQRLPAGAMSLMATIPRGVPAVSIPGESYPVSKTLPQAGDEFVIVYARQQDGRYGAVEVLFHGRSVSIAQFHELACRWIEKNEGGLKMIPGSHAYFAPTRKAWGVILRDGGYTAFDASKMKSGITPELLEQLNRPDSCTILARIQVCASSLRSPENPLPAFARVEVLPGNDPSRGDWISFVEYQSMRAVRSHPPEWFVTDFREWLQVLGAESGVDSWVFRRGMFFGDRIEWWGNGDRRRTEHEGLDFVEGLGSDGRVHQIPEGTPVRVIADGDIVSILDDFLDKTVVVRHSTTMQEDGTVFYTLYSHIRPLTAVTGKVAKGAAIGRIGKSRNLPSHLHLTAAWMPQSIPPEEISLDHINPAFTPVVLINLNGLVHTPGVNLKADATQTL